MGSTLVGLVFANHATLPPRSYIVLLRMAHTALDRPSTRSDREPNIYFAGWELLALCLGYDVPDADPNDEKVTRTRDVAYQAVKRALRPLVSRGLIEPLVPAKDVHTGTRQNYRLHLFGAAPTPPEGTRRGVRPVTPRGVRPVTPSSAKEGVKTAPERGSPSDPPRNQ